MTVRDPVRDLMRTLRGEEQRADHEAAKYDAKGNMGPVQIRWLVAKATLAGALAALAAKRLQTRQRKRTL